MTASSELPRLHLVTDDAVLRAPGFEPLARRLLERGGSGLALHLRGRGLGGRELYGLAAALLPSAEAAGTWLLVNDRVDVALAAGAHGVQLGGGSLPVAEARALLGPDRRIGASVHSAEEAAGAAGDGANFVVVGTIYRTASHPDREGAGPALVADASAKVRAPIVAIGGITPERAVDVRRAGAWGVAVLGGVWHAAEPAGALDAYREALERELEA